MHRKMGKRIISFVMIFCLLAGMIPSTTLTAFAEDTDAVVVSETEATEPPTEAKVSETPAPETPAPETTPETAAPETPAETPAPETPAETAAPETPAPETAAPEVTVPETEAPVQTDAPVKADAETVSFTVEYVTSVDDQVIPIAEAHHAELKSGEEYTVELPDFRSDEYYLDNNNIFVCTKNADGSEARTKVEISPNADGKLVVGGVISQTTRYVVYYTRGEAPATDAVQTEKEEKKEKAPWQVNYYTCDADGNPVLLYAFRSESREGRTETLPTGLNSMLKTFSDALENDTVKTSGGGARIS